MTRLGIRSEASLVNDIRSLPAVWASCVTTLEFSWLRKAKRPTLLPSIGLEKLKDQNVAINGFRKRSKCCEWDISWINRFSFGLWADNNQGMDIERRWSKKKLFNEKKNQVTILVHQRSREVKVVSSISKIKLDQGGFWKDSTDAALPRTDKWRQNEGHA